MSTKKAIVYCRVSTSKQSQEGESLETQEKICRGISEKLNAKVIPNDKAWKESFSGRENSRPVFDEMMKFIRNNKDEIDYFIVRDIDRLTRGGSAEYTKIKGELDKLKIELVDSCGTIQPLKNTLDDLGFEYSWSKYSPSGMAENLKAEGAKDEARIMLTRVIGEQIRLVQAGYKVGQPNDGYLNKRIYVGGKKKNIQIPDPQRSKYYIEVFKLRAAGNLSDEKIIKRINAMGYKTKKKIRWDKSHQKIIGERGGKSLCIKQLQRVIQKPIYCGIICEKWTRQLPVRAQYKGLIDIDTFNRANRGKVFIKENQDGRPQILYDYHPTKTIQRRNRNNPLFPYKNVIMCPHCNKPFKGSSPSGKSKKGFPTYHCARKHKYIGISKKKFEGNIAVFVKRLKFSKDFLNNFEFNLKNSWRRKQQQVLRVSADMGKNVADLKTQKEALIDTLVGTKNEAVRREIEERIERVAEDIKKAQQERDKFELTENDIQSFISYANYFVEHLEDLLLDTRNLNRLQSFFGLVFEEFPTYRDILNGTPKLSLVFELSENFEDKKSLVVALRGIEPRLTD